MDLTDALAAAAEASTAPALWVDMVHAACRGFDADTGAYTDFTAEGHALRRVCPDTDPALHRRYLDEGLHQVDFLSQAVQALPMGGVVTNDDVLPGAAYAASAIFQRFIAPQGMGPVMVMALTDPGDRFRRQITLGRRLGRAGFSPDDRSRARAFALALGRVIAATENPFLDIEPQTGFTSVSVLITPQGGLLERPVGLDPLIRCGFLELRGGVLSIARMPGIGAAIAGAGRDPSRWPPPTGATMGPVATPVGPIRATVQPGGMGAPGAVRLTFSPAPDPDPLATLVRDFALTPRERDIALALSRGETLPEAATRLGIGLTTARSHLQRLFDKTGARHQTALALMVARRLGREFH